MTGLVDLHCHILPNVDDGARSLDDALAMAQALVELGFSTIAPSPHNRPEYATKEICTERRFELQTHFEKHAIGLQLFENAENFFLDEVLITKADKATARTVAGTGHLLIEAPYTSPLPSLLDIIFRMKLRGLTPLIAHPERCMEFERVKRTEEVVAAGALLQLDVGSLTGRYGPVAKKLSRQFLDKGLYAVGATDLHSPVGATDWVGKALRELRSSVGEAAFIRLMRENPEAILEGRTLAS